MNNIRQFITSHIYEFTVVGIVLLSLFLRFYQYDTRWGLAYDQAHDALLAHYAVVTPKFPLLGPFSSAGPFQTGGEWYWLLMIGTAVAPWSLLAPWIFITLLYVLFVYCIIRVAKEIGGKVFSLIAGLFAAISPAQLTQGTNLTNQSPQAFFSLLAIWSAVLYLKRKKLRYAFFLGLSIGIASSIHLSGVGLVFLIVAFFVVLRKFQYQMISVVILGVMIPWIPVIVFDSHHGFLNTQHMLQYYLHDQYHISLEVLGRRWLTYLFVFWPQQWSFVIGGFSSMGYLLVALFSVLLIWRKMLVKEIVMILFSLGGMVVLLRYIHTPLFESYLVFIHPFILLATAWIIFVFVQKKKIIGFILLFSIIASTGYRDYLAFRTSINFSATFARNQVAALKGKYANKKFAVYTYGEKWKDKNYILALYLTKEHLLDPHGMKISTIIATQEAEFRNPTIYGERRGYELISIDSSSSAILGNQGWIRVDEKRVYTDTEEW